MRLRRASARGGFLSRSFQCDSAGTRSVARSDRRDLAPARVPMASRDRTQAGQLGRTQRNASRHARTRRGEPWPSATRAIEYGVGSRRRPHDVVMHLTN